MDALRHAKATLKSGRDHLIDSSAALVQSFVSPDGLPFFHGHIHVEVRKATNLPDMESWIAKLVDKGDVTDPFVDIRIGRARLAKTSIVNNSLNPVWNESFRLEVCHSGRHLVFEVRDKDHAYAEFIGSVKIEADVLLTGKVIEGEFPIKGRSGSHKGRLNLRVCYVSVKSGTVDGYALTDVYFRPHEGVCRAQMYMDAHVYDNMPHFQHLRYPNSDVVYQPQACWRDVYHSLMGARELICISGWAVWDKLHLFRGADADAIDSRNLGDILEEKADAGVRVYVMIWSEKTSGNVIGEKGIMGTHDMETFNRFKRTKVVCALTPRELQVAEFTDILQNEFASGAYTHHQKTIVVDADTTVTDYYSRVDASSSTPPPPSDFSQRRLIAYVGGLDLTGGRWDTPAFPLFSTLMNEHYGDFRNSNAKSVPAEQGPREPWHDIHARVEGPVAYDVYLNFYERWSAQAESKHGPLGPIDASRYNLASAAPLARPSGGVDDGRDVERHRFSAQLFRSITSDSAHFDPDVMRRAPDRQALFSKKGRLVDASIVRAYVQAIRNAKRHIYIENQYFLGSAYTWQTDDDVNCQHIVPVELAQKIVDKIYAGERFTAYVVIPMFPEGDPQSAVIQEILHWQSMTVQMMYKRIGDALKATHHPSAATVHPTDYLLFLCPAKRDAPLTAEQAMYVDEPTEQMAIALRQTMRFPIYVHSKMMIVDDAYAIIGSANINQRSMAGTRDTEIAVGLWQPEHDGSRGRARGAVHMFRMALWSAHFRPASIEQTETMRNPDDASCLAQVKAMAAHNWRVYVGPDGGVTPGQIVCYPYHVAADGKVGPLPDAPTFPDFGPAARVMGAKSKVIPQKVTT